MAMYIPNMKPKQFYDLCKEHGLEIIAVPVPPHGRLIDADANLAVMRKVLVTPYTSNGEIDTAMLRACILMFEEAPTIIEAQEGET